MFFTLHAQSAKATQILDDGLCQTAQFPAQYIDKMIKSFFSMSFTRLSAIKKHILARNDKLQPLIAEYITSPHVIFDHIANTSF